MNETTKKEPKGLESKNLEVEFIWYVIPEDSEIKFKFHYQVEDSYLEKNKIEKQKDIPVEEKEKAIKDWLHNEYITIEEVKNREFLISFNHNKFFKNNFDDKKVKYKVLGTRIFVKLENKIPELIEAKINRSRFEKAIADKFIDFLNKYKRYKIFKKVKRFLPLLNIEVKPKHFNIKYDVDNRKFILKLKWKYIALYIFGLYTIKKMSDNALKEKIIKHKENLEKTKKILRKK